jgi:aryl-alcohol dehydrogenase-like predicted oxidoreductase
MEYRRLGRSDITVSALCLGTMTFGEQNTEKEAHAQLDFALDADINFIDTAEMYPVPPKGDTYGRTEEYIGTWLKSRGNRKRIILASKVVGPARDLTYLRHGQARLDRENIEAALHGSLKRLRTDYLDLYQLHWPDRKTNFFGQLGYQHDPDDDAVPIAETLRVLGDLVRAGKVRHIGLSNETPWGAMRFLQLAEELNLPRAVSVQNPYSLLNRSFEIGMAEVAHREDLGLLTYSPLGFGVLSGKYLGGNQPAGARLTLYNRFQRYRGRRGRLATESYVSLARSQGLDPAQMALAYAASRPFVTSVIIGATTMEQLASNIQSINLSLSPVVLSGIEEIHQDNPNPCP